MFRAIAGVCILLLIAILGGCSSSSESLQNGKVIRINADAIALSLEINEKLAAEFEQATGIRVEIIKGPASSSERLSQYLQYLGGRSPDIDIYQIDVIWPGMIAEHFIDLKPYFTDEELAVFFPTIVENNTVDDRLVAIPWFADAGMLYYRKDLLEKYAFAGPPQTWDELESMAVTIQTGERESGNRDMWGFVFQGNAYEGLTCNALEWQASSGGGEIIEQGGTINVLNDQTIAAMNRAAGWVGKIAPPGVTTYQEEEARHVFQQGNAVFMRNWPYAYALGNSVDSPIRGKFDVTVLPSGGERHASTLGGWQLGVSRYSRNPDAAVEFIKHLASYEAEKLRAIRMAILPARMDLYDDADVTSAIPFINRMRDVFLNGVARPSSTAGEKYNEVSTRYFQHVHRVLTGERAADVSMQDLDQTLRVIMER